MERTLAGRAAAVGRVHRTQAAARPFHPHSRLHELFGRRVGPQREHGDIAVRVACTTPDREAAATLLRSRYTARGYHVSHIGANLASDSTLIATDNGTTIGTITLRLDGPAGLRADETYGRQLDDVRLQGRGVCELARFAIAPDARSTLVLGALFAAAYDLVRELREITDVFIEVNPRHVGFYRKLFGFDVAAGGQICPRVLAPSVLLRLELLGLRERLHDSPPAPRLSPTRVASPALR